MELTLAPSQEHSLFDIGIDTLVNYINIIEEAGTIIANGPMGVFEDSEFATGTNEIFSAISKSDGMTVVGGEVKLQWHLIKWDWLMELSTSQQEVVRASLSCLERQCLLLKQ